MANRPIQQEGAVGENVRTVHGELVPDDVLVGRGP
jgi:hypothetical protein